MDIPARGEPAAVVGTDHCDISIAALRAVVRPSQEQRFGLDKACVDKHAALAGKVYVDARFWQQERLEEVSEPSCQRDQYVIRFDWQAFEPSPAEEDVVVLSFWYRSPDLLEFKAAIEDRFWPRDLPQIEPLGHCHEAWGAARRASTGWRGLVVNSGQ